MADQSKMENTKYGKRRQGRWTPIRAKAQDTRANPNSWETHLVRKRWYIGLLRRAVRRRHCVGGGAPVNFGRRRRRGAGGQNHFFLRFTKKFVLSSKFS